MQYAWLIWSLFFLLIWIILYLSKPAFRKEMLSISFGTMLLGFTEPLFVPEYWNPPTLFESKSLKVLLENNPLANGYPQHV